MTTVLASTPSAIGQQANVLYISSCAGIDRTGVGNSLTGFKTAIAACAGKNITLIIDCPIRLAIGYSYDLPISTTGTKFSVIVTSVTSTGAISGLGTISPGSGYSTPGTYTGVPLTGGSGYGALATIVVTGTTITSVTITSGGTAYSVGNSVTASAGSIVVPSFLNIDFTPSGVIYVDNVFVPAFCFLHTTDCTWNNAHIQYVGACPLDINGIPGYEIAQGNWNDVTIKNILQTTYGNTFSSGGSGQYWGATNAMGVFAFRGQNKRLTFNNLIMDVPSTALATQFIPIAIGIDPEWTPGTSVVTNNATPTSSNSVIPQDITFNNYILDGYYMGAVGAGGITFNSPIFKRYSDLQDASYVTNGVGGNQGGINSTYPVQLVNVDTTPYNCTITSGTASIASTNTFSVNDTVAFSATFGNIVKGTMYYVIAATSSAFTISTTWPSGSALVPNTSGSTTVARVNDGYRNWFPPPHCFYLQALDPSLVCTKVINNAFDYGPYVGGTVRRDAGSGSMCTLKVAPQFGTRINGFKTLRADGLIDIQSYNSQGTPGGGELNDLVASAYDSSLVHNDGKFFPAVRFTGSDPYTYLTINRMSVTDVATTPVCWAISADSYSGNYCVEINDLQYRLNDVPANNWGFNVQGTNMRLTGDVYLANCTSTHTSLGLISTPSPNLTNAYYNLRLWGWRIINTLTFQTAPSGTSATLSNNWLFPTDSYVVTFPSGQMRLVNLSLNSSSASWSPALPAAETSTSFTVSCITQGNINNYSDRINFSGAVNGVYALTRDMSNALTKENDNGVITEIWSQQYVGSPIGASQATTISFPSTYAIDRVGCGVVTNLGTVSSFSIGWTGTPAALLSAQSTSSSSNAAIPLDNTWPKSLSGSSRNILLTPTSGSFDGTGKLALTVRGMRMYGLG